MGELLKALHRLQEIELQLASIRRTVESKARRVAIEKRSVAKAEERSLDNYNATQALHVQFDAISLEVAAMEETMNKHRQALHKARTNKEYASILSAMNTEKADTAKNENQMLRRMEEIQALKDEGEAIEAEKIKSLEGVAIAEAALTNFEEQCADERGRLQAGRDECAEKIAPSALAIFSRVAERLDGEAMAEVISPHPKRTEYVCSGCHMKVALPVVDSLRVRDEIQVCQVCGRILYVEC